MYILYEETYVILRYKYYIKYTYHPKHTAVNILVTE